MKTIGVFLLVGAICLFGGLCLRAQQSASQAPSTPGSATVVPNLVRFSGVLKDEMGRPLTGVVGVTFALYESQEGGAALWIETQNVKSDANGNYTVLLGSTRSDGVSPGLFVAGQARWLGVQPEREPEMPRVLLASVPYALKSGDAQTLGGLPASAFLQAQGTSASSALLLPAGTSAAATATSAPTTAPLAPVATTVTTLVPPGLTSGVVPVADSTHDIKNSEIKDNGTNVGVGSCTPGAAFKIDVCGAANIRGVLSLPSTGVAVSGASGGKTSQPLDLFGSTFNSTLVVPVPQHFRLQEEPVGQSTASPGGKVSLLYASGSATPAETGFSISSTGRVSGNGAGLTGVNATTLGGFAASAFARLAAANSFTANQSITGNLTVSGKVSAGSLSGNGAGVTNVNALSLGGFLPSAFAQLAAANTFAATQAIMVPSEGTLAFRLDSGLNSFLDITPTNTGGRFQTVLNTVNNRDVVVETGTGNVAIGETVPQFGKLQIFQGGSTAALTVDGSNFPSNNFHLDLIAFSPASGIVDYKFVTKREDEGRSFNALTLTQPNGSTIFCPSGCVGIGTTNPQNTLEVVAGGTTLADAWTTRSSRRFKANIHPLKGALEKVEQLQGVSYDRKSDGKHEIGVIAEDVEQVVPEVVSRDVGTQEVQGVDYARLAALLIEAVKAQQAEIQQLKKQLGQLASRPVGQ